jgi:hypothetical protein
MQEILITDNIETNYSGIKKLLTFYADCSKYTDTTLVLDFYQLQWFDANLCSLLEAMLYKLSKENNLKFATDLNFLNQKFDVFFRNGFIKSDVTIHDTKATTMPAMNFETSNKNGFANYVKNELMAHRGMPALSVDLKTTVLDDLIEVFCNTHHHANTIDPFFVAGQYFPKHNKLKFTMVDLGDGFLPRINKATKGEIKDSKSAVNWAIKGNSSKLVLDKTPGGLGLSGILKYCNQNNGEIEIITGNWFWASTFNNTIFEEGRIFAEHNFKGTIINLTFQN